MPALGPITTAPYPTLTEVLDAARTRLLDATNGLQGGYLNIEDNGDVLQSLVNTAWQKMQEYLASLGYYRLISEFIMTGLPAIAAIDPAVQVYVNWTEYSNGSGVVPSFQFPQDLIRPLEVWERRSGVAGANFRKMTQVLGGLPSVPQDIWQRIWEYRNDALYMPGSLVDTDIRLRYAAFLPDFVDIGVTPWNASVVPVMRATDCLSNYICAEVAMPRGDMDGAGFLAAAENAAAKLAGRDSQEPRATFKTSEYGKMKDRFTPDRTAA